MLIVAFAFAFEFEFGFVFVFGVPRNDRFLVPAMLVGCSF